MNQATCQNQRMQRCTNQGMQHSMSQDGCVSNMQGRMQGRMQQPMRNNGTSSRPCDAMRERTDRESDDCSRRTGNRTDFHKADWRQEVPTGNRRQLLTYIDEVSFGAYEALLYLDTHPNCSDGLRYFQENNEKREFALKEYSRLYGPLNLAGVNIDCDTLSWERVNQPWPWEGGNC